MSQRNPMNARYTSDEHKGSSRKSAASAKPKTKAAASVVIDTGKKTAKEKKAARKAEQKKADQKQREINNKYYHPDTPAYKHYRRMWWVCLILAIAMIVIGWLLRGIMPEPFIIAVMILAYVFIIAAFVIEFWKIRKEREAYQKRMVALEESEAKKAKAEARKNAKNGKGDKKAADEEEITTVEGKKRPRRMSAFAKIRATQKDVDSKNKIEKEAKAAAAAEAKAEVEAGEAETTEAADASAKADKAK